MRTIYRVSQAFFPACVAVAALMLVGCTESTTRKDVSKAQDNLKDAKQNTQEAMREGQQDVAEARRDAQEHTTAKPVTPEDTTDARQDIADARQDAAARCRRCERTKNALPPPT